MFPAVDQDLNEPWTAERVEARLVAALKVLPGAPVYSTGGRLQRGLAGGSDPTTDTLSWPRRFIDDERECLILLTWARLKAAGGREFASFCDEKGWPRATAERGRGAAKLIAACLNSEQQGLDSEEIGVGPMRHDAEAAPVLATA